MSQNFFSGIAPTFLNKLAYQKAQKSFSLPLLSAATIFFVLGLASCFFSRISESARSSLQEAATVKTFLERNIQDSDQEAQKIAQRIGPELFGLRAVASKAYALPLLSADGYIVDFAADLSSETQNAPPWAALAAQLQNTRAMEAKDGEAIQSTPHPTWGKSTTLAGVVDGQGYIVSVVPYYNGGLTAHYGFLRAQKLDDRFLGALMRQENSSLKEMQSSSDDQSGPAATATLHSPAWVLAPMDDKKYIAMIGVISFWFSLSSLCLCLFFYRWRRNIAERLTKQTEFGAPMQDQLTGLPNSLLFDKLLSNEAERVNRSVNSYGYALLILDVDRFKEVNDTHGKAVGDFLLVCLTQRLAGALRNQGRLARINGDTFAILQTDVVGPRDVETLARRLVDVMAEPFQYKEKMVFISLSIGIAFHSNPNSDIEELKRHAKLALFRAKSEGRNHFSFYDQWLGEELKMRKTVEKDLRAAIEEGKLTVQYQPLMSIDGDKMEGLEALVRWPHPTHGLISPTTFISLAEECGLIFQLGEWVLRKAMEDAQFWPELTLAVNVSGAQFRQKNFADIIKTILKETGFDPARLELELTESMLLMNEESVEQSMKEVRSLGVRLAMDDFGTGYSSLVYLRRFAFDKIKIDRSFLGSIEPMGESAIIVHSIVHLGRALGLVVTAEGIETREQKIFMQALGAHQLQGYLFSPPVDAATISEMYAAQCSRQMLAYLEKDKREPDGPEMRKIRSGAKLRSVA